MKDWKKAIGLFIIAIISITAGIFCLTVGSIPDWLSLVCTGLGGFLSALGIYWVNPLEKILHGVSSISGNTVSWGRCDKGKSLLFGREIPS